MICDAVDVGLMHAVETYSSSLPQVMRIHCASRICVDFYEIPKEVERIIAHVSIGGHHEWFGVSDDTVRAHHAAAWSVAFTNAIASLVSEMFFSRAPVMGGLFPV